MNAPLAFSEPGNAADGDAVLLAAEQEFQRLLGENSAAVEANADDTAVARIWEKIEHCIEALNNTKPATIVGCATKLRYLADPDYGMESGDGRDDDYVSLRQVLAVVERPGAGIELAPIEVAPVGAGEHFGPCLLGSGTDGDWAVGRWDGEGWYDAEGFPVSPSLWALLPPVRSIEKASERAVGSVKSDSSNPLLSHPEGQRGKQQAGMEAPR